MVFRKLERMVLEAAMYFGLPVAKVAGIYEMFQGFTSHNEMAERLTDSCFLTGAAVYFAAEAAGWLSYRLLNRIVIRENQEKFNSAREKMEVELVEK